MKLKFKPCIARDGRILQPIFFLEDLINHLKKGL